MSQVSHLGTWWWLSFKYPLYFYFQRHKQTLKVARKMRIKWQTIITWYLQFIFGNFIWKWSNIFQVGWWWGNISKNTVGAKTWWKLGNKEEFWPRMGKIMKRYFSFMWGISSVKALLGSLSFTVYQCVTVPGSWRANLSKTFVRRWWTSCVINKAVSELCLAKYVTTTSSWPRFTRERQYIVQWCW